MPKSNLAQSLTKRRFDYIRGMLAAGETQSSKEKDDVAKKFGVHPSTIYRGVSAPHPSPAVNHYSVFIPAHPSVQWKS